MGRKINFSHYPEHGMPSLHKVWDSQGVSDNLETRVWDTPHEFNREMQIEVLRFMDRHLKK